MLLVVSLVFALGDIFFQLVQTINYSTNRNADSKCTPLGTQHTCLITLFLRQVNEQVNITIDIGMCGSRESHE